MIENLFEELEKSQKELEISFAEMHKAKMEAFASIEESHRALQEAINTLDKIVNCELCELLDDEPEYNNESNIDETSIILDETSKELDELLASFS